jgi:hypothetical protein
VRVHVQLQARGAHVSCDVESIPPLSRAWLEDPPIPMRCLESVADRYVICSELHSFALFRLRNPGEPFWRFEKRHFWRGWLPIHGSESTGFWVQNNCLSQLWRLSAEIRALEDVEPKRGAIYQEEYVLKSKHIYWHDNALHVVDRSSRAPVFSLPNMGSYGTPSPDETSFVTVIDDVAVVELNLNSGEARRHIPLLMSRHYAHIFPFYCPNGDLAAGSRGAYVEPHRIWVAPSGQTVDEAWRVLHLPTTKSHAVHWQVGMIRGRVAMCDTLVFPMVCLQ